jgi:hypothetical protein
MGPVRHPGHQKNGDRGPFCAAAPTSAAQGIDQVVVGIHIGGELPELLAEASSLGGTSAIS